MAQTTHVLPSGQQIVTVPREQLKFSRHGRVFMAPDFLEKLAAPPPTPLAFDASKARTIKFPILGNDRYGDCYLADACHCIQAWTGNVGTQAQFDVNAVIARYLQLSGGDNGLGDDQIFPAWKDGLLGPHGQYKIMDEITVDPHNDPAIKLGLWLACGGSWTCSLPDAWIKNAAPGAVWGPGRPNRNNGHAMCLTGYTSKGQPLPFGISQAAKGAPAPFDFYHCETWGFEIPILLTPNGLKSVDPEVTLQASMDMFSSTGIAPHSNMAYADFAANWKGQGGTSLPPSPFGPPPGPGPDPLPGNKLSAMVTVDTLTKLWSIVAVPNPSKETPLLFREEAARIRDEQVYQAEEQARQQKEMDRLSATESVTSNDAWLAATEDVDRILSLPAVQMRSELERLQAVNPNLYSLVRERLRKLLLPD